MVGRFLLQSAVILWLVQTAHTGGYGAASGVSNGAGPQLNGRKPQNGGGMGTMPSKGVGQTLGPQGGYNGYPTKGVGYQPANGAASNGHGAAAGATKGVGTKGYGAAAGATNGQGGRPQGGNPAVGNGAKLNGYGGIAGPTQQQVKGYGAQSGGYGGQRTKGIGNGAAAGAQNGLGTKGIGYGAGAGVPNGNGAKTNGQGAAAGPSGGNGGRPNGHGGAGTKPMKGYGRPPYGAGPGVGMGASRGLGVPQLARNQGKAYGSNGYGARPAGGYNGGYNGGALGPRYGNGGMKGPKQFSGYGAAAGATNGQNAKGNGYAGARAPSGNGAVQNGYGVPRGGATKPAKPAFGNIPNGYGSKPNGYGVFGGAAARSQPGYGNGAVPTGYGTKPNGYGAAAGAGANVPKGYGAKANGQGAGNGATLGGYGTKPQGYGGANGGSTPQKATKGVGAVSPSGGAKTLGSGYGGPAGVPNGHFAKAGYGMMPAGKDQVKGAGESSGLKGGVLPPEQPSAAPLYAVAPQQAVTQGIVPVAPEPTSSILVMVTQEKYQKLPSPVLQGKSYKQTPLTPEATPAPELPGPIVTNSAPEPAVLGPLNKGQKAAASGPAAVVPQSNPEPEPAAVLPQGYVTGSAVPEQKAAEADIVFGVDSTGEGDAAPEGTTALKTKAAPEPVAAKNTGSFYPEETGALGVPEVAPEEANIKSQPVAEPDTAGVKSLSAGGGGAAGNGGATKGQGAKADCGPNGQWMKIPRPDYNAAAGGSAGTNTKGLGYGAGAGVPNRFGAKPNGHGAAAGGYPNGGGAKANKPSYSAGGYTFPGLSNGYGAGLGYPYTGNTKQPGYGQGAYLGAGAGYGNPYGGNVGQSEAGKSKSGYGNGAGAQPDYASLGQGVPTANGKSSGAKQTPYNGAPVVPVGLDGMSQFEPQSASLGTMYGGMGGLPLGKTAEKSNTKYGIGGLQFGGQPGNTGLNGAGQYGYGSSPYGHAGDGKSSGKYGGLGTAMGRGAAPGKYGGYGGYPNGGQVLGAGSNGNPAGKYGYGRMPYEAQPAALSPEAKSAGQYGLAGSPYSPESLGLGQNGKTGKYGGGEVPYVPQTLGFRGKQGAQQPQPLESAAAAAGSPYETLPLQPDSAGKSYVKGEVPTAALAAEGEGIPVERYENVGYINGQVQPEVASFPAAPSPGPTLAYPSVPSYLPAESSFTPDEVPGAGIQDLPDPAGTASPILDSASAAETQGVVQVPEQPDDLTQQQMPRQIHIQQHLKLHFHPQGAKNGKYDLNGFFGNSGYQG